MSRFGASRRPTSQFGGALEQRFALARKLPKLLFRVLDNQGRQSPVVQEGCKRLAITQGPPDEAAQRPSGFAGLGSILVNQQVTE